MKNLEMYESLHEVRRSLDGKHVISMVLSWAKMVCFAFMLLVCWLTLTRILKAGNRVSVIAATVYFPDSASGFTLNPQNTTETVNSLTLLILVILATIACIMFLYSIWMKFRPAVTVTHHVGLTQCDHHSFFARIEFKIISGSTLSDRVQLVTLYVPIPEISNYSVGSIDLLSSEFYYQVSNKRFFLSAPLRVRFLDDKQKALFPLPSPTIIDIPIDDIEFENVLPIYWTSAHFGPASVAITRDPAFAA